MLNSMRPSVSSKRVKLNLMEAKSCIHAHERMILEILELSVIYSGPPQYFLFSQTPQSICHQAMPMLLSGRPSNFIPSVPLFLQSLPLLSSIIPHFGFYKSYLTSPQADPLIMVLRTTTQVIFVKQNPIKFPICSLFLRNPSIPMIRPQTPQHGTQALL